MSELLSGLLSIFISTGAPLHLLCASWKCMYAGICQREEQKRGKGAGLLLPVSKKSRLSSSCITPCIVCLLCSVCGCLYEVCVSVVYVGVLQRQMICVSEECRATSGFLRGRNVHTPLKNLICSGRISFFYCLLLLLKRKKCKLFVPCCETG